MNRAEHSDTRAADDMELIVPLHVPQHLGLFVFHERKLRIWARALRPPAPVFTYRTSESRPHRIITREQGDITGAYLTQSLFSGSEFSARLEC